MSKTGLKFYPEVRKRNDLSKRVPIYMRITKDGKKAEARLLCDLEESEVLKWNDQLGRINIKNSRTNDYLNTIEEAYMHFKILNATSMGKYTAKDIRDLLLNKNRMEEKISIIEYANKYYYRNLEKSTRFTKSTKKNYKKALNHLDKFLTLNDIKNKSLNELDFELARRFTTYLMTDHEDRIGMSEVSACGIIKKFRTIFNEAVEADLIVKNPFLRIKLSYKSPERPKISIAHFTTLCTYKTFRSDEQKVADIFIFMSLTGCAFQDCMDLTKDNIETSKLGVRLRYNRNKTGHESVQFLSEQAIDLLQKFDEHPDVSSGIHLIPRITNQHMNRLLRIVGIKIGVPFKISTHHGRHNYRGLLDEADIVDPSVIRKLMGWSNRNSMDSIYRKVTDSRLIKTRDLLENLLKNYFQS